MNHQRYNRIKYDFVLQFRRTLHAVSSEDNIKRDPVSTKDYVESLHQNNRATLLYGKNNVLVLPVSLNFGAQRFDQVGEWGLKAE